MHHRGVQHVNSLKTIAENHKIKKKKKKKDKLHRRNIMYEFIISPEITLCKTKRTRRCIEVKEGPKAVDNSIHEEILNKIKRKWEEFIDSNAALCNEKKTISKLFALKLFIGLFIFIVLFITLMLLYLCNRYRYIYTSNSYKPLIYALCGILFADLIYCVCVIIISNKRNKEYKRKYLNLLTKAMSNYANNVLNMEYYILHPNWYVVVYQQKYKLYIVLTDVDKKKKKKIKNSSMDSIGFIFNIPVLGSIQEGEAVNDNKDVPLLANDVDLTGNIIDDQKAN